MASFCFIGYDGFIHVMSRVVGGGVGVGVGVGLVYDCPSKTTIYKCFTYLIDSICNSLRFDVAIFYGKNDKHAK
jgi:hypothetical protein